MTREEAIEILIAVAVCDRPILSCDFCARYAGIGTHCNYPTDEEVEDAILLLKGASKDMAISALRAKQEQEHECICGSTNLPCSRCNPGPCGHRQENVENRNDTLTLDELRQMQIGDWLWIEVFQSKEAVSAYYRKYDGYKTDEIFWCGYPGLGFRFFYEDYGKTWLAYRQKPKEDDHD